MITYIEHGRHPVTNKMVRKYRTPDAIEAILFSKANNKQGGKNVYIDPVGNYIICV